MKIPRRSRLSKIGDSLARSVLGEFGLLGRSVARTLPRTRGKKVSKKNSDGMSRSGPRTRRGRARGGVGYERGVENQARRIAAAFMRASDTVEDVSDDLVRKSRELEAALSEAAARIGSGAVPSEGASLIPVGTGGEKKEESGSGIATLLRGIFPEIAAGSAGFGSLLSGLIPAAAATAGAFSMAWNAGRGVNEFMATRESVARGDTGDAVWHGIKTGKYALGYLQPLGAGAGNFIGDAIVKYFGLDKHRSRANNRERQTDKLSVLALDTLTFRAREIEFRIATRVSREDVGPRGVWDVVSGQWMSRMRQMAGGNSLPGQGGPPARGSRPGAASPSPPPATAPTPAEPPDWTVGDEQVTDRNRRTITMQDVQSALGGSRVRDSKSVAMALTDKMVGMRADNPQQYRALLEYLHKGGVTTNPAMQPWCAAFVGSTLAQAGIKDMPRQPLGGHRSQPSAYVPDYHNYGTVLGDNAKAARGMLMVRRSDEGHIGFVNGPPRMVNGRLMIPMRSGNYNNQVYDSLEDARKYVVHDYEGSTKVGSNLAFNPLLRGDAPPALGETRAAPSSDVLIAGDSLAAGLGDPNEGGMNARKLGYRVNARVGAGTREILNKVSPAGHVVISAGANDVDSATGQMNSRQITENLEKMRTQAGKDAKIAWVVPTNQAGPLVEEIAKKYGDKTLTYAPSPRDSQRLHPSSYGPMAKQVQEWLRETSEAQRPPEPPTPPVFAAPSWSTPLMPKQAEQRDYTAWGEEDGGDRTHHHVHVARKTLKRDTGSDDDDQEESHDEGRTMKEVVGGDEIGWGP